MRRRRYRVPLLAFIALVLSLTTWMWGWLRAHGLSAFDVAAELRRGDELQYTWRSVDGKHWQIVSPAPGEDSLATDAREGTSMGCPSGMARVRGAFRREGQGQSTGEVERLQDAACTDWISREFPARCRVFDEAKIARDIERIPTIPMDFCIDRFEFPNALGEYPIIVATFHEASALCKKSKKRLCTENEWTFACEGEAAKPYPYGWTRDDTACVVDRPWRLFTEGALQPRNGVGASRELDKLWQGEPSGTRPSCKSPFGVYDMTGNVDEWTSSVNPTGYRSILKGGYWGPVRARCRPATRAHNEDFVAYQQGFRCCGEAGESTETTEPTIETIDAGASDAGPTELAAPAALRPDLVAEWPGAEDELAAIKRTRASCAAGPGEPTSVPWSALLVAMALIRAMRRPSFTRTATRRPQ